MAEYNPLYYLGAGARDLYGAVAGGAEDYRRGLGNVIGGTVDAAARGWQGQPAQPQTPPLAMGRGMIERPPMAGPPPALGGRAEISAAPPSPLGSPAPYTQQALADQEARGGPMPTEVTPSLGRTPMTAAMGRATGVPNIYETRGLQEERSFYTEGAAPFARPAATREANPDIFAALENVRGTPTPRYDNYDNYDGGATGRGRYGQRTFTMARGPGGPDYSLAEEAQRRAFSMMDRAQYARQREGAAQLLGQVPGMREQAYSEYYGPRNLAQQAALEREKMQGLAGIEQARLSGEMDRTRYQYGALGGAELKKQQRDQEFEWQKLGLAATAGQQTMQRENAAMMLETLSDPMTQKAFMKAQYGLDEGSKGYDEQLRSLMRFFGEAAGMQAPPPLSTTPPASASWWRF